MKFDGIARTNDEDEKYEYYLIMRYVSGKDYSLVKMFFELTRQEYEKDLR